MDHRNTVASELDRALARAELQAEVKRLTEALRETREQLKETREELGRAVEVVAAMGDHVADKTETCSVCLKAYEAYQKNPVSVEKQS